VRAFYRGLSISAAMQAPAVATYLSTYDASKAALATAVAARWPTAAGGATDVARHPATHLAAGLAAETVSAVFWVPMEVLKQRAQVRGAGVGGGGAAAPVATAAAATAAAAPASGGTAAAAATAAVDTSVAGVLRDLLRAEGIRGLFRGYALTVGVFGPYSMIYFVAYERGKHAWADALGVAPPGGAADALPLYAVISSAAASGAVAAAATSPLDVVKTRIQTQGDVGAAPAAVGAGGGAPRSPAYTSTWGAVRRIVAEEGARGLCRGISARVLWIMPGTAITMGTFEALKARMRPQA